VWRIGIDLGGTKIEGLLMDPEGHEVWRERVPTPRESYSDILGAIQTLCEQARALAGAQATIGIGMPGALSHKTGRVKNSNTLVLNDQPIVQDLEQLLGQPVRVENDANCFAVSEAMDGAAQHAASVFGVILGTGVGGGIVIHRRLLVGHHHIAGEWGHNPIPLSIAQEGPAESSMQCYCGRTNCIETFLSGPGWLRREQQRHGDSASQRLPEWLASTEAIVQAAKMGEAKACEALARYARQLAAALGQVINLLDPQAIVLGGGLGQIEALYPLVIEQLHHYVFSDECKTQVLAPVHGDSSGVRGAAWLWKALAP
jgi:fructokinase